MKLVIIDGNAILHRAFHALPPLTTTKGVLINAVYGFVSMTLRVIEELKPDNLVVCFDRPKPTFRQTIFIGYQAKRPKMDAGLAGQIEMVHDVVRVLKLPIYELDGYEADDVMGTLSKQAVKLITNNKKLTTNKNKHSTRHMAQETKSQDQIIIVSGDRDLLQLVDDYTKVYMPTKGISEAKLYGEEEVEEKFGIKPEQIIDYKALIGDASDNYGGIAGIGPKTASDLLREYKTLVNIYKNLEKIKPLVAEKLKLGKESALLAQKLATIIRNAPVKFKLEGSEVKEMISDEVTDIFDKYEFHSLLKRVPGYKGSGEEEKKVKKTKSKVSENQMGLF